MIQIKYRCNKEIVTTNFPKELKDLKDIFKENQINLAENSNYKWLDNFNNKTVSIFDLNYLCKIIINHLDYRLAKKLNAIVSIRQFKSINEIINTINHLNYFGLISNINNYDDSIILAKELFNQIYGVEVPDDLSIPKSDNEWKTIGDKAKINLLKYKTEYGWLFKLDKIPQLKENEIPVLNKYPNDALISACILNTNNKQKLIVPLPQYNDQLNEHLYRTDIFNELSVIFDFTTNNINYEIFIKIQNVLRESKISEVNEFCKLLKELDSKQTQIFIILLNKLNINSITKLIHTLNNLGDIILLEDVRLEPITYATERLNMLEYDDYYEYKKILNKFLNYTLVGDYLIDKEDVIDSKLGALIIPQNLTHLTVKDKKKWR